MDLFDIVAARASGLGGGASQKQADWEQNDSSKKDYIKNRTHWKEEIERDYTVLPNVEPDPTTGLVEYGKKIGLEIGKEYTLEAYLKDGTIQTIQAVATEMPEDELGIAGIPCIILDNICTIVDGIVFDSTTGAITAGDNCYYSFDSSITSVLEKGIIKNLPNVETVVHKIPSEYLPNIKVVNNYDSSSTAPISGKGVYDALNSSGYVGRLQIANDSIGTYHLIDGSVTEEKYCQYVVLATNEVPNNYNAQWLEFKTGNIGVNHKYRISGVLYFLDNTLSPSAEIQYLGIVVNDVLMDFIEVDCSKSNYFDINVILTRYNNSFYELNLYLRQVTRNDDNFEYVTNSKTIIGNNNLQSLKFITFDKDNNDCFFKTKSTLSLENICN